MPFLIARRALKVSFFIKLHTVPFFVPGVNTNSPLELMVVTFSGLSLIMLSKCRKFAWTIAKFYWHTALDHLTQSVMCLATDPGAMSSIRARSHTFMEIDHELISKVILFPSAESFKKGCCQLQAKICAGNTG